jgi:hypothetical protein
MTTHTNPVHFTKPTPVGSTFGPGRQIVSCLRCGAMLIEPELIETHREWHLQEGR